MPKNLMLAYFQQIEISIFYLFYPQLLLSTMITRVEDKTDIHILSVLSSTLVIIVDNLVVNKFDIPLEFLLNFERLSIVLSICCSSPAVNSLNLIFFFNLGRVKSNSIFSSGSAPNPFVFNFDKSTSVSNSSPLLGSITLTGYFSP